MYAKTSALASYGRVANSEADPIQQLVMLYDGAIKFLRLAAQSVDARDIASKAEQTDRALQIVSYLQSILDFEKGGEVAVTFNALYINVTLVILNASAKLDSAEMLRAVELLMPVRDAWAANAAAAAAASMPLPLAQGALASGQMSRSF